VELGKHGSRERITVARLSGTAERYAAQRDGFDLDAAVAELRAISTDRHLLAHAADAYVDPAAYWPAETVAALLEAAGADLDEARALHAAYPPLSGGRDPSTR
jgi:hypothetical protein